MMFLKKGFFKKISQTILLLMLCGSVIALFPFFFKTQAPRLTYAMHNMSPPKNQNILINTPKTLENLNYKGFLRLDQPLKSSQMAKGDLCLDHVSASQFLSLDLYMPSMFHGSTPPKIIPKTTPSHDPTLTCWDLFDLSFFMPGDWQVRVFYKDGSIFAFDVHLNQ